MTSQLQMQGVTIVVRGDFNPAIFHPSWFVSQDLMRPQEIEVAKVQIVHPDVAAFTAEWLTINVIRDRFQAATTQESYYEPLRDLVVGVLSLLSHTPLKAMGINREFHYRLESEATWHSLGHRLVPKQDWEAMLEKPGMASVTVQGVRPDNSKGFIRVKVEPSARPEIPYGLYIEVNDHYELQHTDHTSHGAHEATQVLSEQWNDSMKRGLHIAQEIANLEGAHGTNR